MESVIISTFFQPYNAFINFFVQMIHSSNTNLAPYVPDKIPRHTEYQKQYKAWQPMHPSSHQDQLMENAQREIKAKYMLKTKVRDGN